MTISSPPAVDFTVRDEYGQGVAGLTTANLQFTIAKLIPGENGEPSRWQSYINRLEKAGAAGPGTEDKVQATSDRNGTLVPHGNGRYTYTFATDITNVTSPLAIPYEPALTHRVVLQISGGTLPVTNAVYTWQPSSGATNGIVTREIVKTDSCNECHGNLAMHGGGRVDTRYCVTCHNPGSTDANSGNTIDFKVMVHKLHRGANLPSVVAGGEYAIYGHNNRKFDFSDVVFPQDVRNCTKCHDEADADTPQAGNWMTQPSIEACGSCHDNVDFAQGVPGGHPGGVVTDNSQCTLCHTEGGWAKGVAEAHAIPEETWAARYRYNILSVENTAPGEKPVITFSVTDPTNGDAAYDILDPNDKVFASSALGFVIGWDTADYTNAGSSSNPARPLSFSRAQVFANSVDNGDGTFTFTAPTAIPAEATGTAVVSLQGYLAGDFDGDGVYGESAANVSVRPAVNERVPVTSVVAYSPVTDVSAQPRRQVVAIEKCNQCHQRLSLHGGNRTNEPQLCVVCHNPNNTDKLMRDIALADPNKPDPTDGKAEESIDFKRMIHAIHSANATRSNGTALREKGLEIFGHNGSKFDFGDVKFPGKVQNCETCHLPGTYEVPLPAGVLASTVDTGADIADPSDDANITPTAAACSSCHDGNLMQAHMEQNGASFTALQSQVDDGTFIETCALCHGPGHIADVKVMHGIK